MKLDELLQGATEVPAPSIGDLTAGAVDLKQAARDTAGRYQLDPDIFDRLVQQESHYNPAARSRKGAVGLTQLMPGTVSDMQVQDPEDPLQNLEGGAKYLRKMLDTHNQDYDLALAAYNAGPDNVRKHKGIPPFAETQEYVKKVRGSYVPAGGPEKGIMGKVSDALIGQPAPGQEPDFMSGEWFTSTLPKSINRAALGLATFPYELTKSVTDPVFEQLNQPEFSFGDLAIAEGKNVVQQIEGLSEFMGAPLGVYGLEKFKDVWKNEPGSALLGIAPFAGKAAGMMKGGKSALEGKPIEVTPVTETPLISEAARKAQADMVEGAKAAQIAKTERALKSYEGHTFATEEGRVRSIEKAAKNGIELEPYEVDGKLRVRRKVASIVEEPVAAEAPVETPVVPEEAAPIVPETPPAEMSLADLLEQGKLDYKLEQKSLPLTDADRKYLAEGKANAVKWREEQAKKKAAKLEQTRKYETSYRGVAPRNPNPAVHEDYMASEGVGLYVTKDRNLAADFGEVIEIQHVTPRNPLDTGDGPLYLLEESLDIFNPSITTDSVWQRLNKQAAKNIGSSPENYRPELIARELTRLALKEGYDAINVSDSITPAWTVLIDRTLIKDQSLWREHHQKRGPKKAADAKKQELDLQEAARESAGTGRDGLIETAEGTKTQGEVDLGMVDAQRAELAAMKAKAAKEPEIVQSSNTLPPAPKGISKPIYEAMQQGSVITKVMDRTGNTKDFGYELQIGGKWTKVPEKTLQTLNTKGIVEFFPGPDRFELKGRETVPRVEETVPVAETVSAADALPVDDTPRIKESGVFNDRLQALDWIQQQDKFGYGLRKVGGGWQAYYNPGESGMIKLDFKPFIEKAVYNWENASFDWGNEGSILRNIVDHFLGKSWFSTDISYSKGNIHGLNKDSVQYKFDINPLTSDTIKADTSNKIPLEDNSVKSIMWDPPFLISKTIKNVAMGKRFSAFNDVAERDANYVGSVKEAARVLQPGGILTVKVQNYKFGGSQRSIRNAETIFEAATANNLELKANFMKEPETNKSLFKNSKGVNDRWPVQYLVFEKVMDDVSLQQNSTPFSSYKSARDAARTKAQETQMPWVPEEQIDGSYRIKARPKDELGALMLQKPLWMSKMQEVLERELPGKFTKEGLYDLAEKFLKGGKFKREEWEDTVRLTGLKEFAASYGDKKIPKGELVDWLRMNGIQVRELKRGSEKLTIEEAREYKTLNSLNDISAMTPIQEARLQELFEKQRGFPTQHDQYTLPGGKDYIELVLTEGHAGEMPTDPTHFAEGTGKKNIGWIRGKEFIDAEGRRLFHIEEVQSNRHQEGRKEGYLTKEAAEALAETPGLYKEAHRLFELGNEVDGDARIVFRRQEGEIRRRISQLEKAINESPATPDAPFRKTWPTLLMKRAIKWAADNGYDGVSWSTGEQQHARYPREAGSEAAIKQERGMKNFYGSIEEGGWRFDHSPAVIAKSLRDAAGPFKVKEEVVSGVTQNWKGKGLTGWETTDSAPIDVANTASFSKQPALIFTDEMKSAFGSKPMYMYTFPGPLGHLVDQVKRGISDVKEKFKKPFNMPNIKSQGYLKAVQTNAHWFAKKLAWDQEAMFALQDMQKLPEYDRNMFLAQNAGIAPPGYKMDPATKAYYDSTKQLMNAFRVEFQKYGRLENFVKDYMPLVVKADPKGNPFDPSQPLMRRKFKDPMEAMAHLVAEGYQIETDAAAFIPQYISWAGNKLAGLEAMEIYKNIPAPDGLPSIRPVGMLPRDATLKADFIPARYESKLRRMNSPTKYTDPVVEKAMKDIGRDEIYIHKDIFQDVDSMFTDPSEGFLKGLGIAQSTVKQIVMYNPLFHSWNVASNFVPSSGFWDTIKVLTGQHKVLEKVKTPEGFREVLREMAVAGVRNEGVYNVRRALQQDQYTSRLDHPATSIKDILQSPTHVLTHLPSTVHDLNTYLVFDKMVKGAQVSHYLIKKQAYMDGYRDPLKGYQRQPGLPEAEAARLAALDTNATVGSIPPFHFTRSQRTYLRFLMFARDWNVGTARQLIGTSEKLSQQHWLPRFLRTEGLTKDQWLNLKAANRSYVLRAVVGAVATANMMQHAFMAVNGKEPRPTWQNESGHWLDIDTGLDDNDGKPIYLRNPMFRQVDEYFRLYKQEEGPMKLAMQKAEPVVSTAARLFMNKSARPGEDHIWGQEAGYEGWRDPESLAAMAKEVLAIMPFDDMYGDPYKVRTSIEKWAMAFGTSTRKGISRNVEESDYMKEAFRYVGKHERLSKMAMKELNMMFQEGKSEDEAVDKAIGYIENGLMTEGQFKSVIKGRAVPMFQRFLTGPRGEDFLRSLPEKKRNELMEFMNRNY